MERSQTNKKSLIQWFTARILCLVHLGVSIYFVYATIPVRKLFFIPIIGIGIIVFETVTGFILKFRYQTSFVLIFVYSACIIATIWILELYRINYLLGAQSDQASVEVFSVIYYAPLPMPSGFFLLKKYLWSQIQIQGYVVLMVLLKGLCETQEGKLDVMNRTWATALDTLDFIDLLSQPKLYANQVFVYITFTVWTISCSIYLKNTIKLKQILIKRKYTFLASLITDTFLSVIIMDIPHLAVRLYAIIGVRQHDYSSYFLLFKNIFIIILQMAAFWSAFRKTNPGKNKKLKAISKDTKKAVYL